MLSGFQFSKVNRIHFPHIVTTVLFSKKLIFQKLFEDYLNQCLLTACFLLDIVQGAGNMIDTHIKMQCSK